MCVCPVQEDHFTETEVRQFRPIEAEGLLDGLVMLEYARWGCPAADASIKLQAAN